MLLGEHAHTIDDKNRLTLPARFRHVFGDGIVVTRGMDGCLFAYTRDDWERLVHDRLGSLDPLSKEGRRMQRHFFSAAIEADLDKQGRVALPAPLLPAQGRGGAVVFPLLLGTSRCAVGEHCPWRDRCVRRPR